MIGGGQGKGFEKVITAAIVGGMLSVATGGKFTNGATTAAFAAALAADWSTSGDNPNIRNRSSREDHESFGDIKAKERRKELNKIESLRQKK